MKRLMMLVLVLGASFMLASCKDELVTYNFNYYDYMDTFIDISIQIYESEELETYKSDIADIFGIYHELTNNYETLSSESEYLENIYTLNQKVGQKVEIDEPLYNVLLQAEDIKELTDGYFDISVGKAVDVWKALIEADFPDGMIPEANYTAAITSIEALDFSTNQVILTEEDGHYYIETHGEDLKLDLGAIAKGYATQRVKEYLEDQGVIYYFINAGSSSLFLGSNSNPERDFFNIGLTCPVCATSSTYGTLKNIQNKSVTTSGNYEQYVTYNNLRYHHIVSPITKMPMQYYHSVSLVGDDAGLLDALSTALFSMPNDVFTAWMNEHQADLDLSMVRFNYDETISQSLLDDITFEER